MNSFLLFFHQLAVMVRSFFNSIFSHLCMENKIEKLSGELSVSGSNTVAIPLSRLEAPALIVVAFKEQHHHHHHHHPCNHQSDVLDWQLNDLDDGSHLLTIEYSVVGFRDIVYEVIYTN
jgi:hypothetical protein